MNHSKLVLSLTLLALVSVGCANKEVSRVGLSPPNIDTDKGGTTKTDPIDPATVENWYTKGPDTNVEGVNAELAYANLNISARAKAEVIVAVIDSGVDIEHEDLQGRIWVNLAEKNGQAGVDDDKNGYVDDIHGWNYIGGYDENGKPVSIDAETLEITREMARLKKLKATKGQLTADEEALLARVTEEVTKSRDELLEIDARSKKGLADLAPIYEKIKDLLGVTFDQLTVALVQKTNPTNDEQKAALKAMLSVFAEARANDVARLNSRVKAVAERIGTWYNEDFDARALIVKDDPNNLNEVGYGNNDVEGLGSDHGTHVAGIIAAVRGNGLGVDGIAENIKIMSLRAVPNGDERDKDIANAVRYAADNGARVINMSFGKAISPSKKHVDEAFLYAASKGVVIVHAAGNGAHDNDTGDNFPSRYVLDPKSLYEIPTWVEVGASSRYKNETLTASFSNWGQNSVDLFAPGVDLLSTTPDNTYSVFSGTSMASPTVAGVIALMMTVHPELTGPEVRNIVLKNTRSHTGLSVLLPGTEKLVNFESLSRVGGVADVLLSLSRLK